MTNDQPTSLTQVSGSVFSLPVLGSDNQHSAPDGGSEKDCSSCPSFQAGTCEGKEGTPQPT